jgi:hypothetical protein
MDGYEKETGYHFVDEDDEEQQQLEPKVKSCPLQEEDFDDDE